VITGYGHFVQLAESLQWDETTIDLSVDVENWPKLSDEERTRILGLISGFVIGEQSVSTHLGAFESVATAEDTGDSMPGCFAAQARDEARHARFFQRVASEVLGVAGETPAERLEALRGHVGPDLVALFEDRLPRMAQDLADGEQGLTAAVGLYHMILEGVVLTAGQHALLAALARCSVPMSGVHKGMELVLRDERWHIGFGSRIIQSADLVDDTMEALLKEGTDASSAWGDLIGPDDVAQVEHLHRRRLRSVGIKFW
jgi:ribonucleoside-diphosphate reductase beta chain